MLSRIKLYLSPRVDKAHMILTLSICKFSDKNPCLGQSSSHRAVYTSHRPPRSTFTSLCSHPTLSLIITQASHKLRIHVQVKMPFSFLNVTFSSILIRTEPLKTLSYWPTCITRTSTLTSQAWPLTTLVTAYLVIS